MRISRQYAASKRHAVQSSRLLLPDLYAKIPSLSSQQTTASAKFPPSATGPLCQDSINFQRSVVSSSRQSPTSKKSSSATHVIFGSSKESCSLLPHEDGGLSLKCLNSPNAGGTIQMQMMRTFVQLPQQVLLACDTLASGISWWVSRIFYEKEYVHDALCIAILATLFSSSGTWMGLNIYCLLLFVGDAKFFQTTEYLRRQPLWPYSRL